MMSRHPNERSKSLTQALASPWLEARNTLCGRGSAPGPTMRCALTLLRVLTKRTFGNFRWIASPSGSSIG